MHFLFTVFLHSTATIKMFKNKGFRETFVRTTKNFAKILKNRREFFLLYKTKKLIRSYYDK